MSISNKLVGSIIGVIIAVIVVFQIIGGTASTVGTSAGNMSVGYNTTGGCSVGNTCTAETYPLTSLFGNGGLVLLLFMVGLLITFIKLTGFKK